MLVNSYSNENDDDENIPKEQGNPVTYSIREIVPIEEVSSDSKVTQEEQCQPNTPSIQEIVPLGEIHDDSKEHGKEQCQPEIQNSQERSHLGTPQEISQVEENETQEGQRNALRISNDTTQMCHKGFEILLSYKVD